MPMSQIHKYIYSYQEQLASNSNLNPFDIRLLYTSIALCYLRLEIFDKALLYLEKVMEENFDNSSPFFFAAICVLRGQKPFDLTRNEIEKILEYINAAKLIEAKPIYEYFEAYIRYDYFARKFIKVSPSWQEALQKSNEAGTTETEIELFCQFLGVERPICL